MWYTPPDLTVFFISLSPQEGAYQITGPALMCCVSSPGDILLRNFLPFHQQEHSPWHNNIPHTYRCISISSGLYFSRTILSWGFQTSFLVLFSYVLSTPSCLLYHCVYFPQLVYITSFIMYKKWYIRIYEDTAWRTHAKEKIDRASGQHHDRVVPVYGAWNTERGHAASGHPGTAGKRLEGEIIRPSWDWLPIKFNKCSEFRARRRKN